MRKNVTGRYFYQFAQYLILFRLSSFANVSNQTVSTLTRNLPRSLRLCHIPHASPCSKVPKTHRQYTFNTFNHYNIMKTSSLTLGIFFLHY